MCFKRSAWWCAGWTEIDEVFGDLGINEDGKGETDKWKRKFKRRIKFHNKDKGKRVNYRAK